MDRNSVSCELKPVTMADVISPVPRNPSVIAFSIMSQNGECGTDARTPLSPNDGGWPTSPIREVSLK